MTPKAFGAFRTDAGKTSYELLASSLNLLPPGSRRIVDLACGDGFLAHSLPPNAEITGVDMSQGELAVARKRFPSHRFVLARAQELPLEAGSADAVLCHMAFMLMNPIEPVIAELARILRPGGLFAAVVGSAKIQGGVFGGADQLVSDFFRQNYPKIPANLPTSDPRVGHLKGLQSLFKPSTGFTDAAFEEFAINMRLNAEEFWHFYKYSYFVEMLSSEDQASLEKELLVFFRHNQQDGILSGKFPMQRLAAWRMK